jgi:hypothetical protein
VHYQSDSNWIPEAIKICSYNANSDYIAIQIKHVHIFHIKFLHLKLNCIVEDSFLLWCDIVQLGREVPVFRETCCLQLQGRRLIHVRKGQLDIKKVVTRKVCLSQPPLCGFLTTLVPAPFSPYLDINLLCGSLFFSEDVRSSFLWNVRTKVYGVTI